MKYKNSLQHNLMTLPRVEMEHIRSVFGKMIPEKYKDWHWARWDATYYNFKHIGRVKKALKDGYWGGQNYENNESPIVGYKFCPFDDGRYITDETISVVILVRPSKALAIFKGGIKVT